MIPSPFLEVWIDNKQFQLRYQWNFAYLRWPSNNRLRCSQAFAIRCNWSQTRRISCQLRSSLFHHCNIHWAMKISSFIYIDGKEVGRTYWSLNGIKRSGRFSRPTLMALLVAFELDDPSFVLLSLNILTFPNRSSFLPWIWSIIKNYLI